MHRVEEDGKVGRGVEFATVMGIITSFIRALGHNEKPCAFARRVVQGTETPQWRVARCRKLRVCEHITNSGECAHVEVLSNEVDVVLNLVSAQSSEHVSGGIAFLGHNIVDVY